MKITEVRTFVVWGGWTNWTFLKIYTDEGITGVGEASLEGKAKTTQAAVEELAGYLIGRDPFDLEAHWQNMFYRNAFWTGGPILTTAISGVEAALWDIKGKKLGVPVYTLLGGRCHDRIRLYANSWFTEGAAEELQEWIRRGQTPEDYARLAVATVKKGFTALKWDPFGRADRWTVTPEAVRTAVECVKAVREAVGPDVELLIEAHGRFSPHNAIQIMRELEPYRPFFFEEPVPPENVDAMAKVAAAAKMPIATGERLFTKWGFRDLLEKQVADIIQPDVCHVGGILECKKVAAMAEAYYVPVAPHNSNGPIGTAMTIQLDACIPNFLIQEYFVNASPWRDEVVTPALEIENGYAKIPTRPGLGVELNEEACAKYPYRPFDLNLYGPPL